jgi:tRNA(Ile)-lysidine synthase
MELRDRVRRTIARHRLADPASRVVAAVSGGSDSVALLHLLRELHAAGDLALAGVAHFNHKLRADADGDQQFCEELARTFGVPFLTASEDVAERARRDRCSIERAARAARLEFLERVRAELGGDLIATGHTRDDQAETFLLRLVRGAGARGLAAMHPRNGRIIRPLLDCGREELREHLRGLGATYRNDETNEDESIPRNRVRKTLLPLLADRFNPAIVEALADAAAIARDEHQYLETLAVRWEGTHVKHEGSVVRIDRAALNAAPIAVARIVAWRALGEAAGATVRFADVDRLLGLARGEERDFDGSRQRVERIGDRVVLTKREAGARGRPPAPSRLNFSGYALSIPGEAHVAESGWTVSAEVMEGGSTAVARLARSPEVNWAAVRFDKTMGGLQVRNRRPGDRFWPFGAPGRRKLQDFFTDRKVPRDERDAVPIVVDEAGRIVWVAGYAIDESFRVTDPAQAVIILRLKAGGGLV